MTNPCKQCIVLPMCKIRFIEERWDSILGFAWREKCELIKEYLWMSNQDMINETREIFGLKPVL